MSGIKFEVHGKPVGKGRPRFYNGHAVTPENTRLYEEEVGIMARIATREKLAGALKVNIKAYFKAPKKACGKYATKRPDADNIAKSILDGMNGICYDDDAQVTVLSVSKFYTTGEQKTVVEIEPLENE